MDNEEILINMVRSFGDQPSEKLSEAMREYLEAVQAREEQEKERDQDDLER